MRERRDAHLVLQYGNFEPHYRRIIQRTQEIPGIHTVKPKSPHTSFLKMFHLNDEEVEAAHQGAREATMMLKGSRVIVTGMGISSSYDGSNFLYLKVRPECDLDGVSKEVKDLLEGYRRTEPVHPLHISLGQIASRKSGAIYGSHKQAIERLIGTLDSLVVTKTSVFTKQRSNNK